MPYLADRLRAYQHVDVERDQQLARAAHRRAPARNELRRTEVRLPLLRHDALRHLLVLARTDLRKRVAVRALRLRVLVHVAEIERTRYSYMGMPSSSLARRANSRDTSTQSSIVTP